jgi:hypothetical protein
MKLPICGFIAWCCWPIRIGPDDVLQEPQRRFGLSGLEERRNVTSKEALQGLHWS